MAANACTSASAKVRCARDRETSSDSGRTANAGKRPSRLERVARASRITSPDGRGERRTKVIAWPGSCAWGKNIEGKGALSRLCSRTSFTTPTMVQARSSK